MLLLSYSSLLCSRCRKLEEQRAVLMSTPGHLSVQSMSNSQKQSPACLEKCRRTFGVPFSLLEGSVSYNVYFCLASPLFIYQLNFNVLRKMFLDSLVYILTVLNDCHLNFYFHYFAFVCVVMKQLHFHQEYKASLCNTRLGMVPGC